MLVSFAWRLGVFWQFGNDWSWEDLEHFRRYVFVSEQLWGRFADFGVGILAAVFYSSKSAKQISSKSAGVISTLSFTLLIYLLSIFADLGGEFRRIWYWQVFLYFLVASVFAALIVGLLLWREKKLKRYLLKVFEPLGTISYSFFLWHFLIIVFLADIPKYTQRLPWDFTWLSSFLTSNLEVKAFFIALALSIILSIITYYAIEKPFLKLKKR
jgi:peptidoglycan/LPS O-acetylase OafA/YrhL